MVHAIHVDRVLQQALHAMGAGSGVSVSEALDEFDSALHADPTEGMDPEQVALRRELGVL